MALHYGDDIFEIEIRFPASIYSFSEIAFDSAFRYQVLANAGGTLCLRSTYFEATSGIIAYSVALCNNAYNDDRLTATLEFLLTEILPYYRC